ncbi:MAG: hypothetical protein E7623_05315 [Ruminococcaceae bacterium]|nr:hypothetical protein [Oscillospiraceae bacterium]
MEFPLIIATLLLMFAIFSIQSWGARIGALALLVVIWAVSPHIHYAIIKSRTKSKITSACKKYNAKLQFTKDESYDFSAETDDVIYKVKFINTRYHAQVINIFNDGKFYREYFFALFGKVKIKLPIHFKTKMKDFPKIELSNNGKKEILCYIFVKEPISILYTAVNKPEQIHNQEELFGHTCYTVQGFINRITGEYKHI